MIKRLFSLFLTVAALSGGTLFTQTAQATTCGVNDPCNDPAGATYWCCKPSMRCEIYERHPCYEQLGHYHYVLIASTLGICSTSGSANKLLVYCSDTP